MRDELKEARKALERGRADESLVHLWNVLEPARLAGDRRALGQIAQLATRISEGGDPSEQREATRLLEAVRETAAGDGEPEATVSLPGGNGGGYVPEAEAAEEVEAEQETRGGRLSQFLLPLIFLVIILVNVIARLTGDE